MCFVFGWYEVMLMISFAVFVAYYLRGDGKDTSFLGICRAGIVIYIPGRLFGCVYDSIPLFNSI